MRGLSPTAGAIVTAAWVAVGPSAVAAAPVGETVAAARHHAVVDAAGTTVALDLDGRVVRVVDFVGGTSREFDVSSGCRALASPRQLVAGLGGGAVLLHCKDPEGSRWPVARVLDVTDGVVKRPLGAVDSGPWLPDMITPDGRLRMLRSAPRTPYYYTAIDWRTGEEEMWAPSAPCDGWVHGNGTLRRCDGARTIVLPSSPWTSYAFAHGSLVWRERAAVGVSLPGCRATLRWELASEGSVASLPGAVLISARSADASWTITRVALTGLCERTARGWGLLASSRGRTVATATSAATVPDAETGARAGVLADRLRRPPLLGVRPGGKVMLRGRVPIGSLRWRLGNGPWTTARRAGEGWALRVPHRLRRTTTLQTELTPAAGGTVAHALRLAPVRVGR